MAGLQVGLPALSYAAAPSSVGHIWPWITALADPHHFLIFRVIMIAALALYVAGRWVPFALTLLLLGNVCVESLVASQGVHGHSRQVLGLLLLGQWLGVMAALVVKPWGGLSNWHRWTEAAQNVSFNFGRQMVVATYFVAAVSKEYKSDGFWFLQNENFSLVVLKAQQTSGVEGSPISAHAVALAHWIGEHSWGGACILFLGWFLEFCAPLALLNRRMGLLMGVLFTAFHLANGWFMGLEFALTRLIVFVFFIVPGLLFLLKKPFFSDRRPGSTIV
jgi:hypothetical protein